MLRQACVIGWGRREPRNPVLTIESAIDRSAYQHATGKRYHLHMDSIGCRSEGRGEKRRTRSLPETLVSSHPSRRSSLLLGRPAVLCNASARVLFALAASAVLGGCVGQRADSSFTPKILRPSYSTGGPTICVDEAHYNSHTARGLYAPFAMLMRSDGYRVRGLEERFGRGIPGECRVLVIANATGGKTYTLFGLNLPTRSRERRHESAFSTAEIDTLRSWVSRGGSLLLVADHYPYGASASALSRAFGVDMSGGFTEAANVDTARPWDRSQLAYSRDNGLLAVHPITNGRSAAEQVHRVVTFTGQSLLAPSAQPLLVLGDSAVDYLPPPPRFEGRSAASRAQGVAAEIGQGRAVVLGEAAVLTAQVDDKGRAFGMQVPGNDNQQFALNIVHWLTHLL
jgi:hypothetical protein